MWKAMTVKFLTQNPTFSSFGQIDKELMTYRKKELGLCSE
jgi:hypothetical protein